MLTKVYYDFMFKLLVCTCVFFVANITLASQPKIGEWGTTNATFEIIDTDVKDIKLDNTVLGVMIEASGKSIDDFLSDDKRTLKSFKITYRVRMKLKKGHVAKEEEIIQYGFFKALPVAMQEKLDIKPTQSMTIQYKIYDPLFIVFVVKDETFDAPLLITDKVKLFKKPKKSRKRD